MKLERRGNGYRLNGYVMSGRLLEEILQGMFGRQSRARIRELLSERGWVIIETEPTPLQVQLAEAEKKIAALEREISRLTLEKLYERI